MQETIQGQHLKLPLLPIQSAVGSEVDIVWSSRVEKVLSVYRLHCAKKRRKPCIIKHSWTALQRFPVVDPEICCLES